MTRDEYVEMLARSISVWEELTDDERNMTLEEVSEVLDAIAALAERGGPKLLEREATEKMRNRMYGSKGICYADYEQDIFSRAFDAAPAVPEVE